MLGKKARIEILLLIIALILLIAAFWIIFFSEGSESGKEESNIAADFELTTVNGQKIKLSDFKGKIVLIDFMATWCGPCKLQVGYLRQIWPKYKQKGVVFISVDIDPRENLSILKNYAIQNNITWIIGSSPQAGTLYKVSAIPTIIIIDKTGKIRYKLVGTRTSEQLSSLLDDLLKEG